MKRGIAAIFQYLLAVVVGVILLLLFVRFAFYSTEATETLSSAYVALTLKDSFTSLSVSAYSSTRFPERNWPNDVEFKLGEKERCGEISADDSGPIAVDKIIYGPSSLKGEYFNVWTRAWKYPYKITNFFYLNNKRTKYFLVYDNGDYETKTFVNQIDSLATQMDPLDHIPKNFNVASIKKASVNEDFVAGQSNTNDFVKFVFFNTDASMLSRRDNVEFVVVDIENSVCDDEICKGEVYFGNEKRNFYGKAMLYGAIFAGSLEQYDCNYDRAIKSFDIINSIYNEKALLIDQKIDCDYDALLSNLNNVDMDVFAGNIENLEFGDECEVF